MRVLPTIPLLVSVACLASCGGRDEQSPASAGGSAGAGASAGSSGQAGSAGSPDAGSAGAAASSGQAGSSGSGASGGTAAHAGSAGNAGNAGSAGNAANAGSAGSSPECEYGSTCGSDVCDPPTLACSPNACDPSDYQSCPDFPDTICLEQDDGLGACYLDCTPFDGSGSCGPDATCQVQSDDESLGICYYTGPNAAGETCTPTDTGTDCVDGTVCVNFAMSGPPDRQCTTVCQVFDDGPTGCPAGELCMVRAICLPESLGFYDDVPIGSPCTLDDYYYCGNVAGRLTGTCDDAPTGELRCYAWCRLSQGDDDCDTGFTCTDTDWGNGLGVCVQS